MVTQIWVNIGSGNGFLPDGTKPLPDPIMPMLSLVRPSDFHLRSISREIPQPLIPKFRLKICCLKFQSNLSRVSELILLAYDISNNWQCRINVLLPSRRKDLNSLQITSMWMNKTKCKLIHIYASSKKFSSTRVKCMTICPGNIYLLLKVTIYFLLASYS